jgi:hypothetical protein
MRLYLSAAALISALSMSAVAAAQTAPDATPPSRVQVGDRIYSSDGAVIGRVEYVDKGKDGNPKDVAVIYQLRMVHIPADSLSTGPSGVMTSLKRTEVSKLN